MTSKNLIIMLMAMMFSVASHAQKQSSKIRYSNLFPMPPKVLQNFGPEHVPYFAKKTKNGLQLVKSSMKFVILDNMALVVTAELATTENESRFQSFFKKISEKRRPDGSMYATYCSCGSNLSLSAGDNCQPVPKNDGFHCQGSCLGENEGKTCSFTQAHYPPAGGGAPRTREVTF
jgi:hypothetical protein